MTLFTRLFTVLCLTASSAVWSQGHVRFEKMSVANDIRADATTTTIIEMQYKLLTQEGVSSSASYPIAYMSDRQRFSLLEAYTLKASGQKLPFPSENVQIQKGLAQGDRAISYQFYVSQVHRFPDVAVGDSIYMRYELETVVPDFTGQYSNFQFVSNTLAWDSARFAYRYPKTMPLQFVHHGFTATTNSTDTYNENVYELGNTPSKNLEVQGLNNWQEMPHVQVSSFASPAAMAGAYRATEAPKIIVTPQVQTLADEITAGIAEPRAQFKALYDWIGKNIRYVAVYYGQGGFIPHDVADILKNRFGDCKDQALLLQTLALAKGIEAHTVLLMSDTSSYATPPLAAAGNYNHVIVYAPSLATFADPTVAASIRFGDLPLSDMSKQVLSIKDGAFLTTPSPNAEKDTLHRKAVWTIDAQGNVDVDMTFTARGRVQNDIVGLRKSIEPGKESIWLRDRIRSMGLEGAGTVRFSMLNGVVGGKFLYIKHNIKELVVQDQDVLPLNFVYSGPINFQNALQTYLSPTRKQAYWCMPMTVRDTYEIRWEGDFQMLLPKDSNITDGVYSWKSSFKQLDKSILVERELKVNTPSVACDAANYTKHKDTVQKIDRAIKAQIVYRKN
jgi:transglutaminase-like putative cysteine protease